MTNISKSGSEAAASAAATMTINEEDIQLTVNANIGSKHCDLEVKLQKPGWIIRSVICYSDTIFTGGSFVVHPAESTTTCTVPLTHSKNSSEFIDIRILVGAGTNAPFFICHQIPAFQLRSFALFAPLTTEPLQQKYPRANSHVKFSVNDVQLAQVEQWATTAFGISMQSSAITKTDSQLALRFVDVRSHDALHVQVQRSSDFQSVIVQILTEDLQTAADIVQDMAVAFGVDELSSTCSFARITEKLNDITDTVQQSNTLKTHFAANISENIQNVKVFTVRAEASLMIDDMSGVKKNYAQVQQENTALINEYRKRQLNHDELLASLKTMNTLIRQSSKLRIGTHSKQIVALARACIKNNQLEKIHGIFESGRGQ